MAAKSGKPVPTNTATDTGSNSITLLMTCIPRRAPFESLRQGNEVKIVPQKGPFGRWDLSPSSLKQRTMIENNLAFFSCPW